jgi:amino acid transporter|tara:strand:+ start:6357 stop:6776 length:420 start_codon:yes stop_codon:yes gene_type:complete
MRVVLIYIFLVILLALLGGCSMKTLYPTLGATVGGGTGALVGGPAGGALGAFAGAASGEVLKSEAEVKEALKTAEALSKGDVEALVKIKMDEHKGWFEKAVDGIYDILMISALATGLYFIFHFWYGRQFVKKLSKQETP